MRSILNGSLTLGLLNIPVKLYSAVEDTALDAHQVHLKDGGRIEYKKVCAECGETVHTSDICKMYSIDDNKVMLSNDDLALIDSGKSRELNVLEFVPADSIDMTFIDRPYFLSPADKAGMKAYALLVDTLADKNLLAVLRYTLRGRERLGALGVTGKNTLILHSLRWSDEIRPAMVVDTDVLDRKRQELTDAEKNMANQLVESMTVGQFEPAKYVDNFKVELRELVMSKIGDDSAPEDVSDLLAKLESSISKPLTQIACAKPSIRAWAQSKGYSIGKRGRIPANIISEYESVTA